MLEKRGLARRAVTVLLSMSLLLNTTVFTVYAESSFVETEQTGQTGDVLPENAEYTENTET